MPRVGQVQSSMRHLLGTQHLTEVPGQPNHYDVRVYFLGPGRRRQSKTVRVRLSPDQACPRELEGIAIPDELSGHETQVRTAVASILQGTTPAPFQLRKQ